MLARNQFPIREPIFAENVALRFLGVDITPLGEIYHAETEDMHDATLRQVDRSNVWWLSPAEVGVRLGSSDDVFRLAMGEEEEELKMDQVVPYWPEGLRGQLSRRRMCGFGTIAFDGEWFVRRAATST